MKYLKLFEVKKEPKIGDYVICYDWSNDDVSEFTQNNIGKIVNFEPDELYPYLAAQKYNL